MQTSKNSAIEKPRVAVCLVTYNQEKYIAQAVESILSQKTSFDVCLFIGNDCSTDETLSVCLSYQKKHPQNIQIISHAKNIGTVSNTFSVFREILKNKDHYKYTAMLDGDDYWCDEYKLQKQVDFLEKNPNYGLVHTQVAHLNNKTGLIHSTKRKNVRTGYIFPESLEEPMANCTVVHRTELLEHVDMEAIEKEHLFSCDYITNVIVSKWASVGFINDVTAVWRREIDSVSSSKKIEKSLSYIDHEVRSGKYLSSLFPEHYPFTEDEQKMYIARRKMETALALKNYDLAKDAFNTAQVFENRQSLKFCLKNVFFFSVFLKIRQIKQRINQHKKKI